jgi:GT2 family glycosyltransferase
VNARASIVVPLLNQVDAWLEQAVASALNQTVSCEVIVVTSPRTPPSNRAVLARAQARYSELRLIEREPHMRFAAALNLGIRSATTGRIGLLLTDDWLEPETLEKCLVFDADIVSTAYTSFDANGVTPLDKISREHSEAGYRRLHEQADRADYLTHFFLFRREALDAIGGVDETIGDSPGVDDFDLIWCLLDLGASVAIVEERLYNYRDHGGERLTTRNREDMLATFNSILDKHGVAGQERERLVRAHSLWFGKSMMSVYQELAIPELPRPLQPLQTLYRFLVPLRTRLAIGARLGRRPSGH